MISVISENKILSNVVCTVFFFVGSVSARSYEIGVVGNNWLVSDAEIKRP